MYVVFLVQKERFIYFRFFKDAVFLNPHPSTSKHSNCKQKKSPISSSSTVTSSQDVATNNSSPIASSPPPKKQCKNERLIEPELPKIRQLKEENNFNVQSDNHNNQIEPKLELPDYLSDDDVRDDGTSRFYPTTDVTELPGKFRGSTQLVIVYRF